MKEGWTYKKLGDECSILYGYPFDSKCFSTSPDDMPLIRIRDVKEGKTSTFYNGDYPKDYIIHKGDYLIGMDGEFNISPWQSEDALLNQRVCKISCNTSSLLIRYVYRFLIKELKKIEDETPFVTVKHLSAKKINQINIPVPPVAEQERIVAELDLLQGIIEKKKEQLKAYNQLAQSIFYTMFGDPIDNPKGWETKKLGEIVSVKGRVGWKGYKKEDLRESGPLAIGGGHITENGSMDFSSPVYLSKEKFEESPEIIVKRGDLIMVQRGTIGRIGLIRNEIGDATINPCVLILRPFSVNGVYLLHLLLNKIMQDYICGFVRGVAQPMITQKQVNSLNLPVPPLSLQQEFAEKVEAIEQQKALVQQSIEETQTMFDYTMDKYFG